MPSPPPAPGVARDGDSLCFPLAPGKVPGRPVPQPFLSYCQMVKGGGVPRRAGRREGVCVWRGGPGLGAGPAGVTSYGRGARSRGRRPRRAARWGPGWTELTAGRDSSWA